MKAVFHEGEKGIAGVQFGEVEKPEVQEDEVRVRLKTAGINHRDLIIPNRHSEEETYVILGSDGAGVIDAVGDSVSTAEVGQEVIVNPALGWNKNSAAPPEGFEIVGFPYHGTFAEYIVLPAENVMPKPADLSWEEAGAFALSAMTAYRALFTRGGLKEGQTVFLPGATGGAGIFLIQFAKAKGAKVIVSSRSQEKRQKAIELGADAALDNDEDWQDALNDGRVDLVIESVGAATFNRSLGLLKKGGTLVAFGSSTGDNIDFDLRSFFYGQFNLLGSTMASTEELRDMLVFSKAHHIKPLVDRAYHLSDFKNALDDVENADMMGKSGFNNFLIYTRYQFK
jgi:zinc-binding alcohol dehydrogenase/oxidoreductase